MAVPKERPRDVNDKPERKLLGVSMGDVLKALIGGVVSLTIASMVFTWQAEKPRITWTLVSSAIHKSGTKSIQIANINVANHGIKDAENIECVIRVAGSKIDDLDVGPDTIGLRKSVKEDTATISIPLLGESESLIISLLSSNIQESKIISYAATPWVTIRGKGVRVEQTPMEYPGTYFESFWQWVLYGPFVHILPYGLMVILIPIAYSERRFHRRVKEAQDEMRQSLVDVQKLLKEIRSGVKKKTP